MDTVREESLISAFERQAKVRPQTIAIIDGPIEWTFAELAKRVDRIAARLVSAGIAPSAYVALYVRPSAELVAALLGILKAGAAYIPIDKGTPAERLRFILTDSGVRSIITDGDEIEGLHTLRVRDLQFADEHDQAPRSSWPRIPPTADAYVIYTSGSTGKPKGVVCTHHNVMRLFSSTKDLFAFSESDRWTLFHSIAFDFSVWELFGALLYGGTLVIVTPEVARDTLKFARLLRDRQITVLNQTPSAFYNLVMAARLHGIDCFSGLRYVVLGGEPVHCAKLTRWFKLADHRRPKLVNMYGITETTVHVTYREMTSVDVREHPESSPIGTAIRDLSVYILDEMLRPVADGNVGEICVAGPGVARGYLGRPELTAERFVANPFNDANQSALYRSGDLGRRQSGEFFHVGRADRQVKVRGYRIELGEIERGLMAEKGVAASHVIALDVGTSDARLTAYIIPDAKIWPGAYVETAFLKDRPNALLTLKNGLEIVCLNRAETESMYKEMFEDRPYEQLGISFRDGACVVDVGANIGMFCLLAMTRCKDPRLIAVEPIPTCAAMLDVNLKRYGANASVHTVGLSDHAGTAQFRHFHQATVMFGTCAGSDEASARTGYLANKDGKSELTQQLGDVGANQLVQEKLEYTDLTCQLEALSDLIEREALEYIDVLKISVDKSEADVLNGVREKHWALIRQIVVEIHDIDGRLDKVKRLLQSHGYAYTVSWNPLLNGTSLCNLYAWRDACPDRPAFMTEVKPATPKLTSQRDALIQQLRKSLAQRLPAYMIPAEIRLVPEFPLTVNGKVDERKLAESEFGHRGDASREAMDSIEQQVKDIWLEVLKKEIDFDVTLEEAGAHSLAAVMIALRLYKTFGIEIPPKELREGTSISSLAKRIRGAKTPQMDVRPAASPG